MSIITKIIIGILKFIKHFVFIFIMSILIYIIFFEYNELTIGLPLDQLYFTIFAVITYSMITFYYFYYCKYYWIKRLYKKIIPDRKRILHLGQ